MILSLPIHTLKRALGMALPVRAALGRAQALAWGIALLALVSRLASAQFGYFGQNKIQYRAFDWHVLRGPHVDLYYYPEEQELARVALAYAEESYGVLERRFDHHPHRRIPLIIYASHSDFEQTNVLPFVPPEGLLGVTEFLRRRVALPFTGSYADFRHTLRHELVHVFQLSLSAEVYTRYPRMRRAELPLWWSEGLAEYFSAGEDTRDEMILRDLTVSGRLPALRELAFAGGGIIYPLGGAIHRFLAESYGDWRIGEMYRDVWKYATFEEAVRAVYGTTLDRLSDEWQYAMRQRYYPAVTGAEPLAITARLLTRFAIKPTVYGAAGAADSGRGVLYFSPSTGYTNIYARPFAGGGPRAVVKGERSAEFESFHFFESRLDVSPERVIVFSSRYEDRDALFFWSLAKRRVIGRYQFPDLVSILSPAWAPDGQSVVFSGLAVSGYSDLYRLWVPGGRLERLTSDRYQDLDPTVSPDGRTVVFSSDRTPFGARGARNLFRLDLATGAVSYLTYGEWRDDQPRWAADGRIFFTSDRDGTSQIYSVDTMGTGRRETNSLDGAFDPTWVDREHGLVFGGFADLSYNIYLQQPVPDSATRPVALAADRAPPDWTWEELGNPQYARAEAAPYERKLSFDFVAGDAVVAPGVGSAQGAVFLFSDLLGDHRLFLALSSFQGTGLGSLIDNFNGTAFYLNQARRVNWGVGVFRLRGLFYEGDFNTVFDETSMGGFAQLRYPLSRFRRVEAEYRVEHSDRFDLTRPDLLSGSDDTPDFHRVGWLASNYLSYVEDNTLWLNTGPIDGRRVNLTGGLVNDISHGRFDSWLLAGDYRRYYRTSLRSAFAVRVLGYYAGGERPRRINIGGSWGLRGYPRYGYVAGTRAWLVNSEWRFPITDFLSIGFPFGEARFPGVQAALFFDLGRAWTATSVDRGTLGSTGLGLRMSIGPPLVLRLDLGYRFHSGSLTSYSLPAGSQGTRFADFFFGFNY